MSFAKILDINVNFLRAATTNDFINGLSHEVERKLVNLDETKELPYGKPDIVQLISSIEEDKIRFVQADVSARQLYTEVAAKLRQFKIQHPGFDYLNDSAFNIYFANEG
jgi:hypothetical protein